MSNDEYVTKEVCEIQRQGITDKNDMRHDTISEGIKDIKETLNNLSASTLDVKTLSRNVIGLDKRVDSIEETMKAVKQGIWQLLQKWGLPITGALAWLWAAYGQKPL